MQPVAQLNPVARKKGVGGISGLSEKKGYGSFGGRGTAMGARTEHDTDGTKAAAATSQVGLQPTLPPLVAPLKKSCFTVVTVQSEI